MRSALHRSHAARGDPSRCEVGSATEGLGRNEAQLKDNLGAVGWSLTPAQMKRLDTASASTPAYPYFPYYRQEGFARLNPPAV